MSKRKKSEKSEIPQLPLELWTMVGEVGGPEVWLILTQTIPDVGRYSLDDNTQERMKNIFVTRKETYQWQTYSLDWWYIVTYKLPNGKLHSPLNKYREHEPAIIIYYKNEKSLKKECWYNNGTLHRDYGPAKIKYFKNGRREEDGYNKENQKTIIIYRDDGTI